MTAPLTVLSLTSRFTDDDGVVLQHSTWAVGESKASALKAWKKKCPLMATTLVDVAVVTPAPITPAARLTGPRLPHRVIQGFRQAS